MPCKTPKLTKNKIDPMDHKIANLRGFNDKTGNRNIHIK